MAKFYGKIGYGIQTETAPGVYREQIIERSYYGDVDRIINHVQETQNVNDDFKLNMQVRVVADAFLYENFSQIKYVEWMNSKWKVTSVEVNRPRITLNFGGVYHEQ